MLGWVGYASGDGAPLPPIDWQEHILEVARPMIERLGSESCIEDP